MALSMDCIFCKIIDGTIPSKKVFENERCVAFYDTTPQAPVHVLIVPKEHIESMNCVNEENAGVITEMLLILRRIAADLCIAEQGYRIINNCGDHGGQTVKHLHFHLLGGAALPVMLA